jgi:hypothetical protein
MRSLICRAGAVLALALVFAAPAGASPFVFPPQSHPYGRSYGQWAAAWWQWALAAPAGTSPLLDPTGANCATGQSGPVWFLAGTIDGATTSRSCTVPRGRGLVFPVLNTGYFAFPTDPPDQRTEPFVRSQVANVRRDATGMTAVIDGIAVRDIKGRYYEESPLFSVTLNPGNLFGLDPGTVLAPSVDAGYYLAVAPLAPGRHTLRFTGTLPPSTTPASPGVTIDVTYQLRVG